MIFALFRGLPFLAQIVTLLALIAAVVGGYWYWHSHVYNKGWNDHALAVEMQDAKAVAASTLARQTVAKCRDAGGEWSVVNGVCEHGSR